MQVKMTLSIILSAFLTLPFRCCKNPCCQSCVYLMVNTTFVRIGISYVGETAGVYWYGGLVVQNVKFFPYPWFR